MMDDLAPVALFVYSRLPETAATLERLAENRLADRSKLYIFSDGPKWDGDVEDVRKVRDYLNQITGFNQVVVIHRETNLGLAESIISGVTEVLREHSKIIVVEDDLVTTKNFLAFMNAALIFYRDTDSVKSVNGYSNYIYNLDGNYDAYLERRPFSWGWGTWQREWSAERFYDFDMYISLIEADARIFAEQFGADAPRMLKRCLEGKNDSWYARWIAQHFFDGKLSLYPTLSKVENVGFGGTATHCKSTNSYKTSLDYTDKTSFRFSSSVQVSREVQREFLKYFSYIYKLKHRMSLLKEKGGVKSLIKEALYRLCLRGR